MNHRAPWSPRRARRPFCSALAALGVVFAAAGAGLLPLAPSWAGPAPAEAAEIPEPAAILPPELPWDGASQGLVVGEDDPWITPSERTGLTETPSYDETVAWLEKLAAAAPELALTSIGTSLEGREIWMVVASRSGSTPEALHAAGKPVLLAHGGIHSGEIDGKDAGLMLLRDLTRGRRLEPLLDDVSLLFIPILNVDGHERSGPFNRVNQRGPKEMGWRTNARNLNLNRDFAKLDTEGVRALVEVVNAWKPDLYFDLHVTDGADYQYDITFGYTGTEGYSPAGAAWMDKVLTPALHRDLKEQGHVPGPLVFLVNSADPTKGNQDWTAPPRYSNSYGDARHLPTVLVENHSLKPYPQRVLGTYVLLESALETLSREVGGLRKAVAKDRASRPDPVILSFKADEAENPPVSDFLGVKSRLEPSEVSGRERLTWTAEPIELRVPLLERGTPDAVASRPKAYWVPPTWPEVIERLRIHGLAMETLTEPREVEVEMYRLKDPQLGERPFEGHVQVTATPVPERRRNLFPKGTVRIPTDQPLGTLAALLLEPAAPDSFFQWGFFLEVLQRTEYMEAYAAEALAEQMLGADEELARAFEKRLEEDPAFRGDPRARLQWFVSKTPYQDERWLLYPVGREIEADEMTEKGDSP